MNLQESFKIWCKETKRSGGVLIGSSVREFLEYVENKDNPKQLDPVPIIIGKTNRKFGYNGMHQVEIGSDVFEFEGLYFFEIRPLNGDKSMRQKFYKHMLAPYIDFNPKFPGNENY